MYGYKKSSNTGLHRYIKNFALNSLYRINYNLFLEGLPLENKTSLIQIVFRNLLSCALYWGISHLNYLIFRRVGVLPMPIWPAAGIALIVFFLWNKEVLVGIALGTVLANAVSLGAPIHFALCISIMNTFGPYFVIRIIKNRLVDGEVVKRFSDIFVIFISAYILAPALTAYAGGIGFKLVLGANVRE